MDSLVCVSLHSSAISRSISRKGALSRGLPQLPTPVVADAEVEGEVAASAATFADFDGVGCRAGPPFRLARDIFETKSFRG